MHLSVRFVSVVNFEKALSCQTTVDMFQSFPKLAAAEHEQSTNSSLMK